MENDILDFDKKEEARTEDLEYQKECREQDDEDYGMRDSDFL